MKKNNFNNTSSADQSVKNMKNFDYTVYFKCKNLKAILTIILRSLVGSFQSSKDHFSNSLNK